MKHMVILKNMKTFNMQQYIKQDIWYLLIIQKQLWKLLKILFSDIYIYKILNHFPEIDLNVLKNLHVLGVICVICVI